MYLDHSCNSTDMMDGKDLRMRGTTSVDLDDTAGTIHPFLSKNGTFCNTLGRELHSVALDPQAKKIIGLIVVNIICTIILLFLCNNTNSMALTAYTYLTIFDIFGLFTCLVTVWVQQQKPSPIFSFGYERFEVLAIFASTMLAMFGSFFIVKESIERMFEQPDIHTGRLLIATSIAFLSHMLTTYTMDNRAFNHVIAASSSSWLQEHVSDISESICNVVPGISKLLLPRINPFALISVAGATALFFVHLLIDIRSFYAADTWAALWIAFMTCGTMFPMSVYSGKILLQTTPSHIIGQLDKSIREASTLDGVLEFRHEHFWTLSFGTMAGSVHVRVRRDADEQLVLAHVFNRLSNNVIVLTVQIFKDEWSRPSSMHILNSLSSNFTAISPTSSLGSTGQTSSSSGSHSSYSSIQRSTLPFGGIGLPPVLIPSRTDPAYVAGMSGPTSPNIPALRLAANAPANNYMNWTRENAMLGEGVNSFSGFSSMGNSAQGVSIGNLGNSHMGVGLGMVSSPSSVSRPSFTYSPQGHGHSHQGQGHGHSHDHTQGHGHSHSNTY